MYDDRNSFEFFKATSAPVALLDGNFKLEMANEAMLSLWDRQHTILNTSLLEFMPELGNQDYPDLLRYVLKSGVGYQQKGARVSIKKNGILTSVYMDFSYTPIKIISSKPTAIVVMATELCKKGLAGLVSEETDRNLRALVLNAPVPMCLFKGINLKVEVINTLMLELWQENEYRPIHALEHVYHHAIPYSYRNNNIHYSLNPVLDLAGLVKGVMVMASAQ
jgi:hypothetical protein